MNQIVLTAGNLKSILSGLGKVIGRKVTLPILAHLKISRDEAGLITLQATDLDVWVTYRLENTPPGEPVTFLVLFEPLNKIVKALKANAQIMLIQNSLESSRLVYETGSNVVETKLGYTNPTEWPQEPTVKGTAAILPPEFKPGLKEALECASHDPTRPAINGAYVDVNAKPGHYLVATDGCHLYAGNSYQFNLAASVAIPTHKFITWNGFMEDGDWQLSSATTENMAWFKLTSLHWDYVSKQLPARYPHWQQVVPSDTAKWTQIDIPATAVEMLLRAVPLLPGAGDIHSPVAMEVRGDDLYLKANSKDDPKLTHLQIPEAKATGKPVEITLNREYLLKALRFGLWHVAVEDSLSAMVFSKPGKTMVVMPVRGLAATNQGVAAKKEQPPTITAPVPVVPPLAEARKTEVPQFTERTTPKSETPTESNATKEAQEKVELIKVQLRDLLGDLNDLAGLLKTVEKEKRSSEKEFASVRQTIRTLQGVKI